MATNWKNQEWYDQVELVFPDAKLFQLKGYSNKNNEQDVKQRYAEAKTPTNNGWNEADYEGCKRIVAEAWVSGNKGWLGLKVPAGLVMLDVDRKHRPNAPELIETILKGMEIKCHRIVTPNGRQYVFKDSGAVKQGAGRYGTLGISIDTRTAGKGYIVYPTPNTDGRYIEDIVDELDEYPEWLVPLWTTPSDDSQGGLPRYPIASGRNDFLFRWCGKLASQGQSKEQVQAAAHIIGKYLCEQGDGWDKDEIQSVVDSVFRDEYVMARQPILDEFALNQMKNKLITQLSFDKSGGISATRTNIDIIMNNDPSLAGRLAFNEFT